MNPINKNTKNAPASVLGKTHIYKTVFENTNDGVIIIDAKGKIVDANKSAYSVLGINMADIQLIYVEAFFRFHNVLNINSEEIPKEAWPIERLLKNESFNDEKLIIIPQNSHNASYLSFSGIPQEDKNGKLNSGILIIRDISSEVETGKIKSVKVENKDNYSNPFNHFRKKIKEEQQLLELIINTIPVMVTIYNEKADNIILNKATTEISGWTNDDAAKANIMELTYPDPAYRKEVAEFMQAVEPGFKDIIMRTKDGRDIETSWANVKIPDGRQVGVGIDISGRKKLEKELINARTKAEKENKVQYAFLQNISHEVRTPMNSILGYSELLKKLITSEKESEFIEAILYNGKQLLHLIDDIVDFSRLDKNELKLQKEEISFQYIVQQTRKQFSWMKTNQKKNHLKLSVKCPYNLNKLKIYTDVYRLQQILNNLLSNSIKYSEHGQVELGINIRNKEKDILFYVKDTGVGIKKEDHPRVFSRFNRFHNTTNAESRGTGLGLAICKHLVGLLGGDIWFESEPGKGSTFYFTHPIEKFQLRIESTKNTNPERNYNLPDMAGKTILIAEDDSFSYMLLYHMLSETKATILYADTGKKALEVFGQNTVDLVFLDIRLPEIDGYKVINKIREMNKKVPVIAQTAHVLKEDREKIKKNGFNHHASKPINQKELFYIINQFKKQL